MTTFKKGDRVVCTDAGGTYLTLAKEYSVEHVSEGGYSIQVVCDRGHLQHFYSSRFELAAVKQPSEFLTRNASGQIIGPSHKSKEDAIEYVRRAYTDGYEFELVEVKPVALCKVRKIVEIDE